MNTKSHSKAQVASSSEISKAAPQQATSKAMKVAQNHTKSMPKIAGQKRKHKTTEDLSKMSPKVAHIPIKLEKISPTAIKPLVITQKSPQKIKSVVTQNAPPAQFKKLKFTQPTAAEDILIKCEIVDEPLIIKTLQPSAKQANEENEAIMLNCDDEIEVLDEFYDEVMNAPPSHMKTTKTKKVAKKCTHRLVSKEDLTWCEKCTLKFRTINYGHICNLCGRSHANKVQLKIHMKCVHNVGSAKVFTCDLCGRKYLMKFSVKMHMKNHMTVTPFNCDICGKGFSCIGGLKIHMRNHQDAVECKFCMKKFKPRTLHYHVKKCTNNWELFGGAPKCKKVAVKQKANVKHQLPKKSVKCVFIVEMKKGN